MQYKIHAPEQGAKKGLQLTENARVRSARVEAWSPGFRWIGARVWRWRDTWRLKRQRFGSTRYSSMPANSASMRVAHPRSRLSMIRPAGSPSNSLE